MYANAGCKAWVVDSKCGVIGHLGSQFKYDVRGRRSRRRITQ